MNSGLRTRSREMGPGKNCARLAVATVLALAATLPTGARADQPPPKLPPATYQTTSQEVMVSMDDGVRIATTLTFPSLDGKIPAPGRFPVVVQMTPYGRDGVCSCIPGADLAARGIIGAVADVRGTGGSEGTLKDNYFSPREQRDGYQLVEYFGTRPYSSGKVGMTGGSYLGITQYLAAEQRPPHLTVITPISALSDLYREGYTHEGIPNFFFDIQYLGVQQPASLTGPNTDPALVGPTIAAKAGQLTGGATVAFDYQERPNDGTFYRDRSPLYHADRITVPTLIYDGWHDGFILGANEMYRLLSQRRGVETRLYVNPCTHKGCGPPFDPQTNPSNLEDAESVVFEFLSKYLQPGAQVPQRPPVRVYLQGANRWLDTTNWPPPNSSDRTLYLAPGGLSAAAPVTPATQSYATNPADGLSMSFDQYGTVAASPYIPLDQRAAEEAGLTWRTPQLSEPLALTGDSVLHLAAASSASDTDWFAKLSDVGPDGSETIITEGFLRASHRELDVARSTPDRPWHTNTDPSPIEPGRYYDYDLAIWPTGYELGSGHSLQLRVTSYDFPTHLPGTFRAGPDNPAATSFQPLAPATNTISQGGLDPSYLRVTTLGAGGGSPNSAGGTLSPSKQSRRSPTCARSARLTYHVHAGLRGRGRVVAAQIYVDGKLVRSLHGRHLTTVTISRPHRASFTVKIRTTLSSGGHVTSSRRYRLCTRTRAK